MARRGSRLQHEIRQNRPFASVFEEALLSVLKTADVLGRSMAATLAPHRITPQRYNVLRILRGAGAAGLPTLEIGARLVEQAPGMTRLLDRLEAKRWIHRRRCGEDRRQVLCRITASGLKLLASLDPVVRKHHSRLESGMTAREAEQLAALLEKVRGCFTELPPAPGPSLAPTKERKRRCLT